MCSGLLALGACQALVAQRQSCFACTLICKLDRMRDVVQCEGLAPHVLWPLGLVRLPCKFRVGLSKVRMRMSARLPSQAACGLQRLG